MNLSLTQVRNIFSLSTLKKFAKYYAIFAVANVLFKIVRQFYFVKRTRRLWRHLPGPEYDFAAKKLRANFTRLYDFLTEEVLAYPTAPLVKTSGPGLDLYCNSEESVKWMLSDEFQNVTKSIPGENFFFDLFEQLVGSEGIFALNHGNFYPAQNEKWLKERKLISRIFTKSNFDSIMHDAFTKCSEEMVERLKVAAERNEKVDMQQLMLGFTMDSIEHLFFGKAFKSIQEQSVSEYAKSFDLAQVIMFRMQIKAVLVQMASRFILPFPFGLLDVRSSLHNCLAMKTFMYLSEENQQFKDCLKILDRNVYSYIAQIRADPKAATRRDLISIFLKADVNNDISDKMMRDLVMSLTIAGRDTTATLLTWLFYVLATNPELQENVFKELTEKLPANKSYIPSVADLNPDNLPYLNGLVFETLRFHPPVPLDSKVTMKELVYLDGTVVPERTKLIFVNYAIGRNPTIFDNPEKIIPERWIPFEEKKMSNFAFPAFQAGPRICVGKDMALFEAKLLTSVLVRNFTFKLLEGEKDKISYGLGFSLMLSNDADRKSFNLWLLPKIRG